MNGVEWIGWTATAIFTGSYFCRGASTMRRVQMAGALLWMAYGLALQAAPVVVANVLVLGAATAAAWRDRSTPSPADRRG